MGAPEINFNNKNVSEGILDYSIGLFKSYYRRVQTTGPKHLETNYRASMLSLGNAPRSPLYIVYMETVGCSFSNKVALAVALEAALDTAINAFQEIGYDANDISFDIVSRAVKDVNNALYNYALSVKLVGAIEVNGFMSCFDGRTVSWGSSGNMEGFLGRKNTAYKLSGEEVDKPERSAFGISSNHKHFVSTIGVQPGDMLLFPKYQEGLSLQVDIDDTKI